MSKAFAGFLLALSLFMLFLALNFGKSTGPFFILLWLLIGAFSVYKLCSSPTRAS
jgi:hypothetical protein